MKNKLVIGSTTYTDSNILGGVSYSHTINPDTDYGIGYVTSASIRFTIKDSIADGSEIIYSCKQYGDNDFRQIGKFYVSSCTKNKSNYIVTAYDKVGNTDIVIDDWIAEIKEDNPDGYSPTVAQLWTSLCSYFSLSSYSYTGVNYNQLLVGVDRKLEGVNITVRNVLQWLAEVCAGFIVADSTGNLVIRQAGKTATGTITNSQYKSFEFSDYSATGYNKVHIGVTEEDVGTIAGTGDTKLSIINNPLLRIIGNESYQTIANNILTQVNNFAYRTCKLSTIGHCGITIGTTVNVNVKGTLYPTYIMSVRWGEDGVEYTSTGSKEKPPVNQTTTSKLNNNLGKNLQVTQDLDHLEVVAQSAYTMASDAKFTAEGAEASAGVAYQKATDVEIEAGEISARVEEVATDLDDLDSSTTTRFAEVNLNVNGLTTRVGNAEGNISTLTQTATGLRADITTAQGNITTLQATAEGLSADIQAVSTDLDGEVERATTKETSLQATADGLSANIQTVSTNLSGEIERATTKETAIEAKADGVITRVNTIETTTIPGVAAVESAHYTELKQDDQEIRTTVGTKASQTDLTNLSSRVTNDESTIQQQANKIALVVEERQGSNTIKAASIVTAINNEGSSVKIAADHITLDGNVVLKSNLTDGHTEISGANIRTGSITVDKLDASALTAHKIEVIDCDTDDVIFSADAEDASCRVGPLDVTPEGLTNEGYTTGGRTILQVYAPDATRNPRFEVVSPNQGPFIILDNRNGADDASMGKFTLYNCYASFNGNEYDIGEMLDTISDLQSQISTLQTQLTALRTLSTQLNLAGVEADFEGCYFDESRNDLRKLLRYLYDHI